MGTFMSRSCMCCISSFLISPPSSYPYFLLLLWILLDSTCFLFPFSFHFLFFFFPFSSSTWYIEGVYVLMQPADEYESLRNFSPWAWSTISSPNFVSETKRFHWSKKKKKKFQYSLLINKFWLVNFPLNANISCSFFFFGGRNFMWNELTGSIPKEIGNLASLRLLWVLFFSISYIL